MDDEFQDLEAELRQLRPAPPPARLRAAIDRGLAARPPRERRRVVGWLAVPLATAAVVALGLTVGRPRAPGPPVAPPPVAAAVAPARALFTPVAAAKVPLAPADERLVTLADGTVARRTREVSLTTITWQDPRTNASLRWSVPREEVRVVPVSYQ